jgi:hypothetical protein
MNENQILHLMPYVGIGRATFGMTKNEIESIFGPPDEVDSNFLKQRIEYRSFMNVAYSAQDERAVHFGLGRQMKGARYKSLFIFQENPTVVLQQLIAEDGDPYIDLGFIVLLKLGMTLTGFHDGDESQKAVTLFERGAWDQELPRLKPFHMN